MHNAGICLQKELFSLQVYMQANRRWEVKPDWVQLYSFFSVGFQNPVSTRNN